ncbi:NlpC/P60 family protein [Nocardiopsis sp. EMB25]|uniref:C40 family peptidase n=1 Tax=Nocardiopsis sp. EMB25 TaxID=2835867 RepID=UPI002284DFA2|nr:NlpC/P60 family protein [Nocardiopsis sp. EMB25]MCY9784786.1 NlpC/P60 family protein [Nocardiopsis sp. EMB25]
MSACPAPSGRRAAIISSLTAGVLLVPTAALAEPSVEDVREQIEALDEEFGRLNSDYNEAQETHEAAEARLEEIRADLEDTRETVDELGLSVRALANLAYTGADLTSPAQLFGATGPEDMLAHEADLTYLSEQNDDDLALYVEELEYLESLEVEAVATEEEAAQALEEAEEATEEAEEAIAEQEELLEELTAEERAEATQNTTGGGSGGGGGNSGSGGGNGGSTGSSGGGATYTGPASGNARTALNFAYNQIGKPYVWGGTGPNGYDCSGLVQAAWGAAGVRLPRTTYDQVNAGTRVSWSNMQPGDLIFFRGPNPTHVGMYAGDGMMVHAPNSQSTISEVSLSGYYQSVFYAAVRP